MKDLSLVCAAHGVLGHSTQRSGRARWPGRHRAEGLEGVKLIALIPLHVYHLDPGNYHAESLTPISEQMLVVGNRWEQNKSRMGRAGSAWGKSQGLSEDGRDHSQECYRGMWTCWSALAHGCAGQHRRGNLILGDSSSFLSFGGFEDHSISFPLSPKHSCALHAPVPSPTCPGDIRQLLHQSLLPMSYGLCAGTGRTKRKQIKHGLSGTRHTLLCSLVQPLTMEFSSSKTDHAA